MTSSEVKKESSEGLPIEEVTASWAKLEWHDQTRIGLESIKYIADILASKDRLLATFKHNEGNIIEYLYKRGSEIAPYGTTSRTIKSKKAVMKVVKVNWIK